MDGQRVRRRFMWDTVESGLLRAMLAAVYAEAGQDDNADQLSRLGARELAA